MTLTEIVNREMKIPIKCHEILYGAPIYLSFEENNYYLILILYNEKLGRFGNRNICSILYQF